MPKASFWIALQVAGPMTEHRAFDDNANALAWVKSHKSCVLLGGKTLSAAAEKAHGRVPDGTIIPAHLTLARNRGVGAAHAVTVPAHGPVTAASKRLARQAARVAQGLPAIVPPTVLGGVGVGKKRARASTEGPGDGRARGEGGVEGSGSVTGADVVPVVATVAPAAAAAAAPDAAAAAPDAAAAGDDDAAAPASAPAEPAEEEPKRARRKKRRSAAAAAE